MYPAYRSIAPAPVGGTGTTTKIFPALSNSAVAAILAVPSGAQLEGQQFYVRAGGRLFVHGTTPTVNVVLQSGSSLTPGSNVTIATLGSAQALTTNAAYPWFVEAILQGDSTSGIVQGSFRIGINNTISAWAALSNALTGVNFGSGYVPSGTIPYSNNMGPALQFVVGITFGVSDALNTANLNQSVLES